MIIGTNKLDPYHCFTLDENNGCLMLVYCLHGAIMDEPFYPDWDNLTQEEEEYYERVHHYYLSECRPQFLDDHFPFGYDGKSLLEA